jgi:glucose dehydrogenase
MPGRDFAGWRYSGLEEIDAGNVGRLKVAWTFSTGVLRGQEAAPVVAGGAMFVVTPYPNVLYALDLTREGASLKWKHEPKPLAAAQGGGVLRRREPRGGP